MKNERDKILATDPIYNGETLVTLEIGDLHKVCRQTIAHCQNINEQLQQRFASMVSERLLDRRAEREWLEESLDVWFCKKWNDKRRISEAKKTQSPTKKSAAHVCNTCKKNLVCVDCEGISPEVSPFTYMAI
jgi:hypothetical protein